MKSTTSKLVIIVLFFVDTAQVAASADFVHLRPQGHWPHWLAESSDNRDDALKIWNKEKLTSGSSESRTTPSPIEMLHSKPSFKGCTDPSEPFQCPQSERCIALQFICDGQPNDCPDNNDENEETCIAVKRPAKENIENFLRAVYTLHGLRLFTFLFGQTFSKTIKKNMSYWLEALASAFSVSKNIRIFGTKLRMPSKDLAHFRRIIQKIHQGLLEEIPLFAQEAVNQGLASLIEKLHKSGFMEE
ncbi:unnamed protein product [Rotaria socialis]|uniref:Prohormone-4 n=1 Tax=Rotaria socialis TaxID=392032 RepID=A0A821LEP5_9BILA|nr:unnamed protein product [Rotaria socialis]CAF3186971.1 unnamed protein product [Rotaria socialis]CAF3301843.1 unnamed protein product [Rotaria socialis]CAF3570659.1 unnamed protein product [Rotaria socialis]CAF3677728.1 unnamed protein product [Rotaria socialis]